MAYKQISPIPIVEGGTGAQTLTGVLTGNGTSAITANAVTEHGVLIGAASNAVSSLGVALDGQLIIGATGSDAVLANLTSTGGTISITNGAGSINLEANGSAILGALTPDSGAAVTPTAGAISITSYPLTSGNVAGVKTYNGGTSVLQIANLDAVTPYMVGTDVNTHPFTSIGDAIAQAVTDGASAGTPAVVWITAGAYTEDLSLVPYVHLAGAVDGSVDAVQITGNAIFTGVGLFSATNVSFLSANTDAALSFQGSDVATCHLQSVNCNAGSAGGIGFECINENATINVSIGSLDAGAGGRCLNVSAGSVTMYSGTSLRTDTASTISGNAIVTIFSSALNDAFVLSDASELFLQQASIDAGGDACIDVGATSAAVVSNSILRTSGDFIITGSGTAIYANIVANQGTIIQNTINQVGPGVMVQNISFDGGVSILNGDGQVWIGSNSGVPTPANLTAGTGISITNAPNSITIKSTGAGFDWYDVTTGSATLAPQSGYVADSASLTTFTLPTNSALGDTIRIIGRGTGGWEVVYGTGQFIEFSSATTTTDTGSLSSTNARDCIDLVCNFASVTAPIFIVSSSIGNITVI